MSKATPLPFQQELQEAFDYRDGNLWWKKTNTNRVKVGSEAGYVKTKPLTGEQYVQVRFKGKYYYIHRLIWAWHGNSLEPNQQIDHIDGNSLNNRIENLRAASRKQNGENRKGANKNNINGVKGVCCHEPSKKWCAYIRHNGKLMHLGLYESIDNAIAARIEGEKKYFTNAPDRDNEVVTEKPSGVLSFI